MKKPDSREKKEITSNKKFGGRAVLIAALLVFCAAFNIAAWISTPFSDFFTDNVFTVIAGLYGRFTSIFPFSVGEILLVIAVILIAICAAGIVILLFDLILKKSYLKRFLRSYFKVVSVIIPIVMTIMSLNCFVLYHCTPIVVREDSPEYYTIDELAGLRDYIVTRCNELSLTVPRDERGQVIYDGDMNEAARQAMRKIDGSYRRLEGYYVYPKALVFSGFMSQQYMQGYYFPFSMEANYNDEMYIMNKPFTMCHELSHTHGYIYEDEANFLGFLACIESEDPVFVYSGYLGVLNYVNNDFFRDVDRDTYDSHVRISDLVRYDDQFLTDEAWERVEERAVLDTETVRKAADTFIDTNLKVNGVSSGKASYGYVVRLLLDYYSVNGYN